MTKAANGEGSLFFAKGRWHGVVTVGWAGKVQKRKYVSGKTKTEARERRTELIAKLQAGRLPPHDRIVVGQWMDRWEQLIDDAYDRGRLAYKTWISYKQVKRAHICHEKVGLQRVRMAPCDADRLQRWMDDLADEGVQPPSVKYALDVLRIAWKAARRARAYVGDDPTRLVTAPAYRRRQPKPFTGEGAVEFLTKIKQDRLFALFVLGLTTGLRPGEQLGERWMDVDERERCLWPRQQLQRQTGKGLVLKATKTERSEAPVALTGLLLRALEAHKARMREERLRLGPEWRGADDPGAPDALVFVSEIGTPLDPDNMRRHFKDLLEETGAGDRRLYDSGRHSAGSILRALGVPLHVIQEVLRHTKLATTMKYAHGDLSEQRDAAARLDVLLGGVLG